MSQGALLAEASTFAPSAKIVVDGEDNRSRRESLSEDDDDDDDDGLDSDDDCADALVGSQMANGGADPDAFDWLLLPPPELPGLHPFFTAGFELPAPGIEVPIVDGS